jgi:hypothetical protein
MDFSEITQLTSYGSYSVHVPIAGFLAHLDRLVSTLGLQLCPDFQRSHVWSVAQQSAFLEFLLRGGITSPILLNHPGWLRGFGGDFVCVDGLQRITAITRFLDGDLAVFGGITIGEFTNLDGWLCSTNINFRVNNLKTRREVLDWYLQLNSGGTQHTQEELNRVREMLENL